ncbi:MAG: hypothetical protein O9284_12915 [Steroidobacteraceae bacterium]|nr:hypothetical protein [Steroidobacteraceae bacterium]
MADAPRFLFVPVSGPTGMGEYARCLTLAGAVRTRWPAAEIHFLLSEKAPYARTTPYPYTLFPGSPTLHDHAGRAAIARFAPHVAVFDNAGRAGQLAAARAAGARVVFVSSRWKPRLKAFRLRWMRHLDEHWIPYPEFVGGSLTAYERLKLLLAGGGRPRIRYLDVLLPEPDRAAADATLAAQGVTREGYVLVVPGGGTGHPGAEGALRAYETTALRLAARGHAVVVVGSPGPVPTGAAGPGGADVEPDARPVRWAGRVPPAEIATLLANARLVVTNGGDTLLQALAFGRPAVAAPIAADQPERLAKCAARGGVVPAALDAAALVAAAVGLLDAPEALVHEAGRARALGLANGVQPALDAFAALLSTPVADTRGP